MSSIVHEKSVTGFDQSNVDSYNKGRPSYNDETIKTVNEIIHAFDIQSTEGSVTVCDYQYVELGAGTGKFTKSFLQHPSNESIDRQKYMAIEPSAAFLASLEEMNLHVKTHYGAAQSIPIIDRSVSVVLVAQAFHWMASVETLEEIHRILIPGRPLIMIWNSLDRSVPWLHEAELHILQRYYTDDIPRFITGKWKNCFETPRGMELFQSLKYWEGKSELIVDEEQVVDRVMSVSVIASLGDEEKEKVRNDVLNLLRSDPSVRRSSDGKYIVDYSHTVAWTAAK